MLRITNGYFLYRTSTITTFYVTHLYLYHCIEPNGMWDGFNGVCSQSASVQSVAALSDLGPTISENATAAADSSVTLNRSASAMSMRTMPTSQYLVGSGKADITGAAAETGMFGYAAG